MPTPWASAIKDSGQLTIFNKAKEWANPVNAAIRTFNNLSLGVKLVSADEEQNANVVVVLALGAADYDWPGNRSFEGYKIKTKPGFKADILHGQTSTVSDPNRNEIQFALIFLPGSLTGVNDRQKEVVVVHEFIHSSGLDGGIGGGKQDPKQDHDVVGIMVPQMKADGSGLIEYMPEKGAKPMPPIRVGAQTLCKIRMLWTNADSCKK